MQKRVWLFRVCFAIVTLAIAGRLFQIQILQHDEWVARAEEMHVVQRKISAKRGEIYMLENDEPVAVVLNQSAWTVVIDPQVANPEETEKRLEPILGEKRIAGWQDVFANRELRYYMVARNLSRTEALKIRDEDLAGVWLIEGDSRVYPEGEMASVMLGFVNADGEGQYGVEGALDEELAGEDGLLKTVTDANNIALSIGDENVRMPAVDGKNIVLTLDRGMQRKVENDIREYLKEKPYSHASVLVMNPQNGEVWTMATVPTYDAGNYAMVSDASVYSNPVTDIAYEPASICKTFAFAAAIEEGKMTPETVYYNPGFFTIDSQPIKNAYEGKLGEITMQTAFNYSLNTGSMTALMLLDNSTSEITARARELLYDYYYNRFGLGQYTGIELYEAPGYVVKPDAEVYGLNALYADMTFGQNMQLTMIQTAAAFASVINGGEYYRPTIIAGEMKDGEFVRAGNNTAVRRTISEETSATMREMLYGTRTLRRLYGIDEKGYYVGGKTGTAQTVIDGAYSFDETVASYIGFGGTEGELPEYIIMVKVWESGQKLGGESDAQPLFDQLSDLVVDYLKIKPKE